MAMRFKVVRHDFRVPDRGKNIGFLWADNWNDYWKYQTLYVLTYFDEDGLKHDLGGIKIGQFAWQEDQHRPTLPSEFDSLDDRFFSLGQDVSYYAAVAALGTHTSSQLLTALKDIVADPELRARASEEDVMGTSLLRSVSIRSIEGQFKRVLDGGAVLTDYSFTYEGPQPADDNIPRVRLDFQVRPDSKPPTNIHVIIGRNGVGKTFLLNGLTRSLVSFDKDDNANGVFRVRESLFSETDKCPFANIVSITFSAFDDFALIPERRNALKGVRYSNIGLRQRIKNKDNENVIITRAPSDLASDFSNSAKMCLTGQRTTRWERALTTLQTDPIFEEAHVAALANVDESQFARHAGQLFRNLSSGHKIVLLTITKLVEKVEEKSLVLMDEPEAHLHPPLLAAFVRALSDLLIDRNGVAIVATHSPVVLQEVPASCVWKIVRHGLAARADRPEIETFGENVGVLTREVFGLEVTRSGFHRLLAEAVDDSGDMDDVLRKFDNEVGAEGRALISSMIAARDKNGGS
jgi:predicted ATPase